MPSAQGHITVRRRAKDGTPGSDAVRYWVIPSVTQIKKTEDRKYHPSSITCEARKQTGNSSPVATSEGTLKYQIGYTDNSASSLFNYSKAITIPANCQWIRFVYYVNNTSVASETVSVVADGESVYLLDLDNEMQGIPCNSSGTPTISGTLASTNSTVYKGAGIDSGWAFSKTDSGCTSTINSSTGKVSVTAISADKASVTVKATKGAQTLSAVMSLYKVRAGADGFDGTDGDDGVSPVIYSIEVSANAISRNAAGTLSPSSITAYKNKTVGNTKTRTSNMTLKYKRVGQDTSETILGGEGGTISNINAYCTAIELKIYNGATILDSERIPIVKDGTDGKGIESITVYFKFNTGAEPPENDLEWKTLAERKASGMMTEPSDTYPYMWKKTVTKFTDGTSKVVIEVASIKSEPGKQGIQGMIIRRSEWKVGTEYHNDENLTDAIRYLDIALIKNKDTASGWDVYKCRKTHTSSTDSKPGTGSSWGTYWEKFGGNFAALFTSLIVAKDAVLEFMQGNQLLIKDENDVVTAGLSGSNGGKKIRIWAGSKTPDDAPFRVDVNGALVATKANITGTINATAGTIAGFKISGSHITNEGFDNDAAIIIRNDERKVVAAMGANVLPSSLGGIRAIARFQNNEDSDFWGDTNYGVIVSAKGASQDNIALSIEGGCVQGLALKTMFVGLDQITQATKPTYVSKTIGRDVNSVLVTTEYKYRAKSTDEYSNQSREVRLTLPTMEHYDDGHIIFVKRGNNNNNVIKIYPGTCYRLVPNSTYTGFVRTSGTPVILCDNNTYCTSSNVFELKSEGDASIFIYHRTLSVTIGSITYHGVWVQHKCPREW